MHYSVDRIEDGIATLVDGAGQSHTLPATALPQGTGEGDILRSENGSYTRDEAATAAKRAEAQSLLDKLLGR